MTALRFRVCLSDQTHVLLQGFAFLIAGVVALFAALIFFIR
jgi:hypothetical protein